MMKRIKFFRKMHLRKYGYEHKLWFGLGYEPIIEEEDANIYRSIEIILSKGE